ncbi:UNVERIFIED_ORG: NAD(P)-dependent dehydrogenase (short-subunit alcohol dehydrogenase family) [Burkholderia sp. CF145]
MNSDMVGTRAWLGLTGRVCVVTGAGSGIGAETARELAALGASVALLDRDGEAAGAVAMDIERAGGHALGIRVDVSESSAVAAASETVRRHLGECGVLVNNAALVGYPGPLLQGELGQWNRMIDVNLTGSLICAQEFGKQMVAAGGGSIVNVTSICGHLPLPGGGAYSVAKAGLIMLTRMLALELAPHGIRCNSVSPGLVRTPATEAAYRDVESAEARTRMVPSGRIAEPADLANAIVFLASERAAYINGEDVLVDGALSKTLMNCIPKPAKPVRPA